MNPPMKKTSFKNWFILIVALLIALCFFSSLSRNTGKKKGGISTNTPNPTKVQPQPTISMPTETPEPIATLEQLSSSEGGGLGLSKTEWEVLHKQTNKESLGYTPIGIPYDNKYDIFFMDDRVWFIQHQYPEDAPATIKTIEEESKAIIPLDSQLVNTYSPPASPETIVKLYFSEHLKNTINESKLNESWWDNGEPGNFIVLYHDYGDGIITDIIIGPGNNP